MMAFSATLNFSKSQKEQPLELMFSQMAWLSIWTEMGNKLKMPWGFFLENPAGLISTFFQIHLLDIGANY